MGSELSMARYHQCLKDTMPITATGRISKVVGLIIESHGPPVKVGGMCLIHPDGQTLPVQAEVVGFREGRVLLMPLQTLRGIGPGCRVVAQSSQATVGVGESLLGRVLDGLGNPIDGKEPLNVDTRYPIYARPVNPLSRKRIRLPMDMGIRALNGPLTIGQGQRMGIFAGSGVGKSILLGMIARNSGADVNVVALIGERGRELNEFIERDLGLEGLKRSVVVVATSDQLPLIRMRGAFIATAIAEYFRDLNKKVILMMDSLTRFAMAQREVGLAAGEPPTTKGYTPSVFTLLPQLLERAGTTDSAGSITGLYTVLVEGDDMNEPIADAARGILDGHTVLSRDLANQNHFPAIDVLSSVSRVMPDVVAREHRDDAGRLKEILATYRRAEDLINVGAYAAGSNPKIDKAISLIEKINAYLRQDMAERTDFTQSAAQLKQIFQ